MGYLTYEEYTSLGGKCPSDTFPSLQFEVESKMDYITSGRLSEMLKDMEEIPLEVKMLEVKLVNIFYEKETHSVKSDGLTSYSNGIESFGYAQDSDTQDDIVYNVKNIMMQYLYPRYPELFYRGRVIPNARNNNPA